MPSIFDQDLAPNEANYAALSPLSFIERTAEVYPDRLAVVHGGLRRNWAEVFTRCRQLASALQQRGIVKGDTVAVMLPNTPPMVEAHFGIPVTGAVLNALNTRLDPETIAFMLDHGEAKVVIVDAEFAGVMKKALALRQSSAPLLVIDVEDALYTGPVERIGSIRYDEFLASGDAGFAWRQPDDEWDAIALNYTSGTTGNPKGVVYHHRGAALNAVSNILEWDMPKHAVYLWTLPMFHCNGWCFPWTVAARAGVNVCLRRVEPQAIFDAIRQHGVTHYCGAPIVHGLLVNSPASMKQGLPRGVKAMVAGAAPPASMIEGMEALGFDLTHVYGLTEVYGPATVCAAQDGWEKLDIGERARLNARQGVRYHLERDVRVLDSQTLQPVPQDGETMGEIMFRGNIAMKGYLKNPKATEEAFLGGWFHSGDLAVMYPDGYIKIKDRSKDVIISGGENISSIEVEDVLYRHPDVLAAAVVAKPDERWGETPCAFVELKVGATATKEDIVAHCKKHLAGFKVPRAVVFGELPKTSTGKIQKFELRKLAGSAAAIDV
ncbi:MULTISPECIES: acyl-CoA synthetase [unclassified Polaromonas]|jgi:fatty-acyl-CoA synthase|uniref:acyl-CoA synthetase n=1 Tax=unclassified Polaromonas TaxID=2638319 RepID=UPI000BD4CDAB|nr:MULTISPECIES: acyl-CoA synthetase [unclassified Polaromonas]OYY38979.1 MAG: acyl-CoA synthetase [Polaromonas sp. 35-63-35]OYZ21844.1 MAG: acyl-CoA synthetase [Polaromonas sp. 16-63-31]OYZ80283.1 MAG: acyl-CoA synthetase [Polaromonas sp. 24-63-21]OZA51345.1 MAG: acyl-CoA synthetase [Polaromonas sp. 17-63-33]OZA90184.1 MAG: acyl-CoA synthetase [Polaromonas sp. 39-63-25]